MHRGQLALEYLPWLPPIWPLREVQHQVLGLEVDVHNLETLQGHEGAANLLGEVVRLLGAQKSAAPVDVNQFFEGATVAVLGDDVEPVFGLDHVQDLYQIAMPKLP